MGVVPLSQALDEFKTIYMPARNYAPRTRIEYAHDIGELVAFLENGGVVNTGSLSLSQLERYLAWLDEKGFAGATRKRKVVAVHTFCGYLAREGYTSSDISKALITPFAEKNLPKVLTRTEYTRLLAVCAENPRDLAIITLFLQTGIKLSELVRLNAADIELADQAGENSGWLKVQEGSGRRGRVLPLNQKAGEALRNYLLVRSETDANTLFLNRAGWPLGSRGVQKVIEKYMGKAGIRGASVHSLRHTFGTHHAAKGTSIKTIQKVMGHKDPRTTEVYLGLAKDILAKEVEENAL